MAYSRLIQSGNLIEIYQYEKDLPKRRQRAKKRNGPVTRTYTRRSANLLQLRKRFIRLVRANLIGTGVPFLLTLTVAQIVSIERAYVWHTEFFKTLRRYRGEGFRYISVPEFQKRGAPHFHVLIWGLDELCSSERDTRILQNLWRRGYVDCVPTNGDVKLAWYLGKYMQKAVQDSRIVGQKSYVASRNVLRSVSLSFDSAINNLSQIVGVDNSVAFSAEFETMWLGRCKYSQYVI